MKRESILIFLGILIILAPFSGLPQSWLEFLLPALGLIVGGIGFSLRNRRKQSGNGTIPPEENPSMLTTSN